MDHRQCSALRFVTKGALSVRSKTEHFALQPCTIRIVKNIASMAIMSHKDCGLDYSPMSQMVRSHVKKLANEINVLDQSEEGLHQRKGNAKNRFSKCDEWD